MGAGVSPFSLLGAEGHQPRLLHILHRDSIGPARRTWVRGGGLGVWNVPREGPLALFRSLGLTFCSLKVNASVLWALACVPQTVSVCGRPCASGVQMHVACVCGCVRVCGVSGLGPHPWLKHFIPRGRGAGLAGEPRLGPTCCPAPLPPSISGCLDFSFCGFALPTPPPVDFCSSGTT